MLQNSFGYLRLSDVVISRNAALVSWYYY